MEDKDKKARNAKIKESRNATKEKRKSQTCHVFQVKIQHNKINAVQREALHMIFVEAKWFNNAVLNHSENGNKLSEYPDNNKTVIHMDKDKNYLETDIKYLSVQMRQSLLSRMIANIKSLSTNKKKGTKVGKLKFKSYCNSIDLKQLGLTYAIENGRIRIQGIKGWMKVNGLDQFINKGFELANAKLMKTPRGYYIAVTCYKNKSTEPSETEKEYVGEHVGIDMGCETAVTLSDGRKLKAKVIESNRLKNLQRKLERQVKRSKRWFDTKRLIGVEHQKNTARKDDLSNKIIHDVKQYKFIYMQDELLKKWQRTGHGKAVSHSVLGRVKAKLKPIAAVVLPAEAKTTQQCYNCDKLNPMPLGKKIYTCSCGIPPEDRDVHSAKVMVYFSLGFLPVIIPWGTTGSHSPSDHPIRQVKPDAS